LKCLLLGVLSNRSENLGETSRDQRERKPVRQIIEPNDKA
jgi:hypothetical protein